MRNLVPAIILLGLSRGIITNPTRIVEGDLATDDQFKFAAAIYVTNPDGLFFCGGTLISDQWILTAGQCVYRATAFEVRLGSKSLTEVDDNRIIVRTSLHQIHPFYNPENLQNDVGLVKFEQPLVLTDHVRPVDYLAYSDLTDNAYHLAFGWGEITDDSDLPNDHLHYTYLTSIPDDDCKGIYQNNVMDNMVCLRGYNNVGGICTGDAGSALIMYRRGHFTIHVAIASFYSNNGCEARDPSGFTRTYRYVEWISSVTNITSEEV